MTDKVYPVADIDDVAGFMAAARAYHQQAEIDEAEEAAATATAFASNDEGFAQVSDAYYGLSVIDNDPFTDHRPKEDNGVAEKLATGFEVKSPQVTATEAAAGVASIVKDETTTPFDTPSVKDTTGVNIASPISSIGAPAHSVVNDLDEDRENLAVFKSWGTPPARDKPASRIRRIIVKGLPSNWRSPAKVLSLIHGGTIESIHIGPSGTAHVLFCEHEACKAFYDKYPNGIDLDKDKGQTVFVEMGKDVDVVSSQLSFNLSVGATRVVRVVGADMEVGMGKLLKLASMNNRKVEKIIDTYIPGDARNVVFRFCSIYDAVTFRAMIVRDHDWEHCNVQYAKDPCEIATGVHVD